MEELLVGPIFYAMMISGSEEGFVPFSATRCGRVAKSVKICAFTVAIVTGWRSLADEKSVTVATKIKPRTVKQIVAE